jgi:predicted Zn-dependent protease
MGRRDTYDRKKLLEQAERARAKKRNHRAISFYRRVLAAEPANPELHARIAPLLAKTGQDFDAWQSYRRAGRALIDNKQWADALALHRKAADALPYEIAAWQMLARLERSTGSEERALEALLEGRRRLRRRRDRPQAIALLRAALELAPWRPAVVLDLARLLVASRQSNEARWILDQLAERESGPMLRQLRALQWRIDPGLGTGWRWLRSAFGGGRGGGRKLPARPPISTTR